MKLDRVQILILISVVVFTLLNFAFPFRYNEITESYKYGYQSFLNWVTLIYVARLGAHAFGFIIFDMIKGIYGLLVIIGINIWFKGFMFKTEATIVEWEGIIYQIVGVALVIGALLIDKSTHETGMRSTLSKRY